MGRMVLLLHTLPDGSSHFDWIIERAGGPTLLTFRVGLRVDEAEAGEFEAERLPDHRRAYLEYEGEVSGGRGAVRRVAAGGGEVISDGEAGVAIRGRFAGGGWREWVGRPAPAGEATGWRFQIRALDQRAAAGGQPRG